MSKYEVKREEFRRFVEATHYRTDAERNSEEQGCWSYDHSQARHWAWWPEADWRKPVNGLEQQSMHPVGCVSFYDAQAYIAWLNRESGQLYRLPTEAEWEYAARAGTTTSRYWGNNADLACRYANVADEHSVQTLVWPQRHRCDDGKFFYQETGGLLANAWGLFDMLGNVWEWTCSRYVEVYDGTEQTCLPGQADAEVLLVQRGGGWNADPARVRAAYRNWGTAWVRQANLGFRLAKSR